MSQVKLQYNVVTRASISGLSIEEITMLKTTMPTQALLHEMFNYNEDTGLFTRIKGIAAKGGSIGTIAGYKNPNGYVVISILGTPKQAHRLAWLYVHGILPTNELDHINGVRDDNRLSNLREVTSQENSMNSALRSDNNSGHVGVYFKKDKNKWCARIHIDGKSKHLGYFKTKEEAIACRVKAQDGLGFTERHGKDTL